MILLADSGSTKTDWRLINDLDEITQFTSSGLNPYFINPAEAAGQVTGIRHLFEKENISDKLFRVFFYGAGCGTDENKTIIREILAAVFPKADIGVYSDMLGAAHALCGRSPGLVAILGTGMNSCYFNGNEISMQQPSLGYVLGDEGSGAYLGKCLLADYLNNEMPPEIRDRFENRFKLKSSEILHKLYKEPYPSRFLASFSKFIYQNISDQYCSDLVANSFRSFFEKHICKYPSWESLRLSCTGSVAFWYSNVLRRVAEEKGVMLDRVVESPIAALSLYYLEGKVNGE
jgi:glucosamine kinase